MQFYFLLEVFIKLHAPSSLGIWNYAFLPGNLVQQTYLAWTWHPRCWAVFHCPNIPELSPVSFSCLFGLCKPKLLVTQVFPSVAAFYPSHLSQVALLVFLTVLFVNDLPLTVLCWFEYIGNVCLASGGRDFEMIENNLANTCLPCMTGKRGDSSTMHQEQNHQISISAVQGLHENLAFS